MSKQRNACPVAQAIEDEARTGVQYAPDFSDVQLMGKKCSDCLDAALSDTNAESVTTNTYDAIVSEIQESDPTFDPEMADKYHERFIRFQGARARIAIEESGFEGYGYGEMTYQKQIPFNCD